MTESLFAKEEAENRRSAQPLAARMRPRALDEFVGQQHFLGEGKLLRRLIKADRLTALLFYGPPGTGKTTLAHLLAKETQARFHQLNAVTSGVKELREALEEARNALAAS
jgi:putative ATPase